MTSNTTDTERAERNGYQNLLINLKNLQKADEAVMTLRSSLFLENESESDHSRSRSKSNEK